MKVIFRLQYDISNVDRAWTSASAVMNGIELSEELPESYPEMASKMEVHEKESRGGLKSPYRSRRKDINGGGTGSPLS